MLTHTPRWSHAPGNRVVPSRWQATSSTRPLSFFEAFAYAFAYLLVTSARDSIDNPLLMPHTTVTVSQAFLREARGTFRGQSS
jgi:hypothetical protein